MAKIIKGEKRGRPGKFIVDYRDYAGIRRWKTFDTKREAEAFYADLLKIQDVRTKPMVNVNVTLGDYADHWLDTLKRTESVKRSTREIYKAQLRRYILPGFPTDQRVRNLQRGAIKAWALALRERLSRTSTKLAFTTLGVMLNAAVEDGLLPMNPCRGLGKTLGLGKRKRHSEEEDVKPFSGEQVNIFMETARRVAPHYFPILLTLYQSGVRIGECLGLQWDDLTLDPKGREIHVQRSIDNKTGEIGTPKNGTARHVDLSLELLDTLKKHKVGVTEQTLREGWGQMPEWVFPTVKKGPIQYLSVWKAFKKVLKAAKLPDHFALHSLRHTFATLHLELDQGRLLYVSRQLGHSSISITADVYAKWLKPTDKAAADSLATDAWKAAAGA